MVQLNITAEDAEQHPIPGAIVTAYVLDKNLAVCPLEPKIKQQPNFYSGDVTFTAAMGAAHPGPYVVYGDVMAAGFSPGCFPKDGGFGVPWDGNATLNIRVPLTASFRRPLTRDERLAVRGGFCSHPITLNDYGTIPCFDPFVASLDAANRQIVYATKRALGLNAIVLSARYAYDEPNYTYPIPGHDWRNELPALKAIVQEAISAGLIPILTLTDGGQEDWHYWFDNDGANYRAAVTIFKGGLDLTRYLVSAILWEVIGPGGDWTPDQVGTAQLMQRSAWGEDAGAVCAIEYGSGYAKAFLSGHESGQADWDTPAGMAIDLFLYEAAQPVLDPLTSDRNYDCTAALLGPAARVPPPVPPNQRPGWYLRNDCPRGPRVACVFEDRAYDYIRGRISPEQSVAITAFERGIGWTVFGNLGSGAEL